MVSDSVHVAGTIKVCCGDSFFCIFNFTWIFMYEETYYTYTNILHNVEKTNQYNLRQHELVVVMYVLPLKPNA